MQEILCHNFRATLVAAGYKPTKIDSAMGAISIPINKLAKALNILPYEQLHCFFSPHIAGLGKKKSHLHAWKFVIPSAKYRYDKGSVKVCFFVTNFNRSLLLADAKHWVFFTANGLAQIADDMWCEPDIFAGTMARHMRRGDQMNFYMDLPEDIVLQVLPLLNRRT